MTRVSDQTDHYFHQTLTNWLFLKTEKSLSTSWNTLYILSPLLQFNFTILYSNFTYRSCSFLPALPLNANISHLLTILLKKHGKVTQMLSPAIYAVHLNQSTNQNRRKRKEYGHFPEHPVCFFSIKMSISVDKMYLNKTWLKQQDTEPSEWVWSCYFEVKSCIMLILN